MPKRLLTKYGYKEVKVPYIQPEPISEDIRIMFEPLKSRSKVKVEKGAKKSKIK
jgi:hypothetical protein